MKIEKILYVLMLLGVLIGAYLTIARYSANVLVCPESGAINCESVITSQYSEIFGVPTSVMAIILFLLGPFMMIKHDETRKFLWSIAGAGAVMYSLGAMSLLREVCLYCLSLDALVIIIIVIAYRVKKQ